MYNLRLATIALRKMTATRRRRLACLTVIVCFLFLVFALTNEDLMREMPLKILQPLDMNVDCYREASYEDSFPMFDVSIEQDRLSSGKNIFFHETSCFGSENDNRARLNCRQACAVESAARANPSMSVNLLFLSPSGPSNSTQKLVDRLLRYDNVRISRVLVGDYVKDTPLEKWYEGGILQTSNWPRSHMSDIMRYLTLWRFGGVYLDLDVVVIKSLEDLTNYAGAEDWLDVAAGVIGLSPTGLGRRIANACLRDLLRNFRGNVWGNNGPGVITRTLQKFCNAKHAKDMTIKRCGGFEVFPPAAFYPIFYKDWKRYFIEDGANATMQLIERARAIHVWNKLSASEVVRVGSKVPYALVAEKNCPRVYYGCGATF